MFAAPRFWTGPPGWQALALAPFSRLYGTVAARRMRRAPRAAAGLPVLCVGNLTVGGNGKTPAVIALAEAAKAAGLRPGILSRGHGGRVRAARLVDAAADSAAEVGDEPLLLARHAPVAVGVDRAAGARLLKARACDFLLMDDGFQSARIGIDLALLVVDRGIGAGNGFCLPAGPLRAPVSVQLAEKPDLLLMGEGSAADALGREAARRGLPVHAARLAPAGAQAFGGRRVLAFAGIGRPEKFWASLEEAGALVVGRRPFPDHHPFRPTELESLRREAEAKGLALATTAKDAARLRAAAPAALLEDLLVLDVAVRFAAAGTPAALVERTLARWRERQARTVSGGSRPD